MWVKLCGLRTAADVEAAVAAGADAVGFVLVDSPRQVDDGQARALAARVAGRATTVGVFRRLDSAALARSRALGLDLAQGVLDGVAAGEGVLPVLADGSDLPDRAAATPASRLLVDGPHFGSGETADWDRIAAVARGRSIVLAGGLAPDNIARAIARVRPGGVDVSSGIESERGVKDPQRMHAFVRAARRAAASMESP
jgi:phosphoribosylanthranilate isomerase